MLLIGIARQYAYRKVWIHLFKCQFTYTILLGLHDTTF